MANKPIRVTNFSGGLNYNESTTLADNELAEALNVYYDNQGILSTRKGILNFGNNISGASGIHSIYFTTFSNATRHLLCGEAGNIRKYNEATSNWDIIKSGLTSGLRLSMITYKDNIYITNGTDNMMYYDGTTVTDLPANTKVKYLSVDKDVCYGAGVGGGNPPFNLYFTTPGDELKNGDFSDETAIDSSAPADATGLSVKNGKAVVGTSQGLYLVDVFQTTPVVDKIDYDGDLTSNRSIVNVENNMLFMSSRGMYSMSQREGTTGSYRADSYSSPIQKIMDAVEDKTTASAFYYTKMNNVYLSVNYKGDRNNSLFVYSVVVSLPGQYKHVWTRYENINANDFCEYIDASGDSHLLVANSFGGQVVEMETGFTDNDVEILSTIRTKTFDFGVAETLKSFARIDVGGLISKTAEVNFCIDIDGVETCSSFTGGIYAYGDAAEDFSLGEEPLAENVLGGGAVTQDGVSYFPFMNRRYPYQTGYRMSIKMESRVKNSPWKFTKANIEIVPEPTDVFYNTYIS